VVAVAQWFQGRQQGEREHGDENFLSVPRYNAGHEILVRGT
jgi:hypothetical protein